MTLLEPRPITAPDDLGGRPPRELPPDPADRSDHVAAILAAMAARVAADHPEADLRELHALVVQAYARFEGAPVQAFREILSERAVRRELLVARAERAGNQVGGGR